MVAGPESTFTVIVRPELARGTLSAKDDFFFWAAMDENLEIL
jgi:hypothetical protein